MQQMASQQMDHSLPYMMELETKEIDELLTAVKTRQARSEMERMNHLPRSESSDMEFLWRNVPYGLFKIQKVPEMFCGNESSAEHYTPMVVSIGPYHHGSKGLDGMEETKKQMAYDFVKKSVRDGEEFDDAFKRLYGEVASHAFWAMGAYDDANASELLLKNLEHGRLASIMFLDGCFVLEFIRSVLIKPESLPMNSHVAALVKRDLFLLENQLPFGVLRSLMLSSEEYKVKRMEFIVIDNFLTHMRAFPPPRRKLCRDRVSEFPLFRYLFRPSTNLEEGYQQDDTHLLGLFHKKFIKNMELPASRDTETLVDDKERGNNMEHPASPDKETLVDYQEKRWYPYRAAMELKRVGIECEPARTKLFTDIHFTWTLLGGKLKIPRLTIHESTMPLILNLVAYEASLKASNEIGVTPYICFMSSLIDREEDVSELRSKDILFHTLGGDEQVAKFFSDIANNLVPNPNAYSEVKKQIESHYKNDFKMWYNHYSSKIYSAILKIVGLGTAIFGAMKVFTSLTISPMPGMQLPGFCKFQLSNATLYH